MSIPTSLKIGGAGALITYAGYKFADNKYQIAYDLNLVGKLKPFREQTAAYIEDGNVDIADLWEETVEEFQDKTSMIMIEDNNTSRSYSFNEMNVKANQMAHWLTEVAGLKRGDTVALLMENRPEYISTWLGCAKAGIKCAFINTHIKQKGLLHCVKISESKLLLFGFEQKEAIHDILNEIKHQMPLLKIASYASPLVLNFVDTNLDWCDSIDYDLLKQSTENLNKSVRNGIGFNDKFGYIYTSGTTGLPKAAVITHAKLFNFGSGMVSAFEVKSDDIILSHLPLFHSSGCIGANCMIIRGNTLVIRRKFSATSYFEDAAKYNCTVSQYIGEMMKFLLFSPKSQYDKAHKIRVAIGNGLRPEIWAEVQDRFNIPEIGEFYGATEGNGALVNHCKSITDQGACGRLGFLAKKALGTKFVKFDVENEEVIRGKDGFCIDCVAGEPGELLFPIKDAATNFAGYESKEATDKKILCDAFEKGDKYFRTGDLLKFDEQGYIYFVDRIGDTFRWKGENCSTTEVTEVVAQVPGIEEVNVYGIQIPNNLDGRAPLAAITPIDGIISNVDFQKFGEIVKRDLPSYAQPMFIRVLPQVAVTATLKHQKVALRNEGIDLALVSDPLYWLNPETKEYEPFTAKEFAFVSTPGARL